MRNNRIRLPAGIGSFLTGDLGASAVEFAVVIPLFVLLTLGLFNMAFLLYAANALHFATERAARCFTVTPTSCPNQVATPNLQTYGAGQYKGPTLTSLTFSVPNSGTTTTTNCGNHVRATASYTIQTGLVHYSLPIQADACFPSS